MDAIVVGSGPNGLAAAITMAQAGWKVRVLEAQDTLGGGARSAALTLPGFIHDRCSAIHPLAIASPFLRSLPLEHHGLHWIQPEVPLAHPLDDGSAVLLHRSVEQTSRELGPDGRAWQRLMQPFVNRWEALMDEFLQPLLHLPRFPFLTARFGVPALLPATWLAAKCFRGNRARALFAGIAAHSFLPLEAPGSAAFGLVLGLAGHIVGWPLPLGGAQRLSDALAAHLLALGGTVETGHKVTTHNALPKADAILLDLTAWQVARIAGSSLPPHLSDKLAAFPHGPSVFKIDYALSAPIPWAAKDCARAATVHLGGTFEEIAQSEREVAHGTIPTHPFVLLAQPTLFDSTRAPAGHHIAWAYCHLPRGSTVDMTEAMENQIERFAPGFRSTVLARTISRPQDLQLSNANLDGGDISGGASNLQHLLIRPFLKPYRLGRTHYYLCSSSTPPGGGVHGMCGYHAARRALSHHQRTT
jgi:phytoene dehydrogenase-like protein